MIDTYTDFSKLDVRPRQTPSEPFNNDECMAIYMFYLETTANMSLIAEHLHVEREAIMKAARRATNMKPKQAAVKKRVGFDFSMLKDVPREPGKHLTSECKRSIIQCLEANRGMHGIRKAIARKVGVGIDVVYRCAQQADGRSYK